MTSELRARERRAPLGWMAGNHVASNLLMAGLLVGGYFSLRGMGQEVFPDIEIDSVSISVSYPASSPEEVEEGIVLALENAARSVEGVDEVSGYAYEGHGTVTAEVLRGVDVQRVAQEIKTEVDRITTFPDDIEIPRVRISSRWREVLDVVIHGDVSDTVLHRLAERARDELIQDPHITVVELEGLPELEIVISVPQEQLRRYGLTHASIASILRETALDLPSGALRTRTGEILLRVKERRDYGEEFAKIPVVTTPEGDQILLGDIAEIDDGFGDRDRFAFYNGKPAITLEVFRVGDQTPIQVSDAVQRLVKEIQQDLPPGVGLDITRDRSDIYRQRIELLLRNGGIGLVLVLFLLALFLEPRVAFWVALGIPISFLGSFIILPFFGMTLNMVSLFAFIIALGIVVDDAIIVGENIFHYHQQGLPPLTAAVRGVKEVIQPVTFSILTNIVTFMPIYFIPGHMGKIFQVIPIVVCTVFIISLVESFFVLPAHLAHLGFKRRRNGEGTRNGRAVRFRRLIERFYGPLLDGTLRFRILTVAVAFGLLIIALAFPRSGRMGFSPFPTVESDRSESRIEMPFGTPAERTEEIMRRVIAGAKRVAARPECAGLVEAITSEIGRHSGPHSARVRVLLAPPDIREKIMSTKKFTDLWRDEVGEIAGVDSLRFIDDAGGPGSWGRALTVELSHRDMEVIEQACTELARALEDYQPAVRDIDDGFQLGKRQIDFTLKPEGHRLGFTPRDLGRQLRSFLYGAEVLRQQRGRNEIRIKVRLPESERDSENALKDLLVRAPSGRFVPLREVADLSWGRAYTSIRRREGRRVLQVSADVRPRSKAIEVINDLKANVLPNLCARHQGLNYTFEGHQADMRESTDSLRYTFLMALLAIYTMLAIPFRSFVQPLIVMTAIPFGVVGAFVGHMIMGYDLSLISIFGIVALSGVVVNDSLVLIDFANRRRKSGLTPREAIRSAALQRFRPVMLTTLTTFGGLAPMIFETSRQARFLIPMALSLGFGILFATVITLIIIPALYLLVYDVETTLPKRERRAPEGSPEPPSATV